MKKFTTVSLFIFGVIVTAVLVAGLVFYQNINSQSVNVASNTINKLTSSEKNLTLDMLEISKHNSQTDCWILISGKVYAITSYFGLHPGGNANMYATCGEDATAEYNTQDPNATSSSGRPSHSSRAVSLLNDYYLGDFNQIINPETKKANADSSTTIAKSNTKTEATNSTPTQTEQFPIVIPPSGSITLSMVEVSKHNKQSDCWYLISGKIYNITSFFGSHPGGNSAMISSCGKDATAAYMTKDPGSTSSGTSSAHSSNAVNMLANYYIGNLNQTIGEQKITETNSVVAPTNNGDEDEDDD